MMLKITRRNRKTDTGKPITVLSVEELESWLVEAHLKTRVQARKFIAANRDIWAKNGIAVASTGPTAMFSFEIVGFNN